MLFSLPELWGSIVEERSCLLWGRVEDECVHVVSHVVRVSKRQWWSSMRRLTPPTKSYPNIYIYPAQAAALRPPALPGAPLEMAPKKASQKDQLISPSKVTLPADIREELARPFRGWADKVSPKVKEVYAEYLDVPKVVKEFAKDDSNNLIIQYATHTQIVCGAYCGHIFHASKNCPPNPTKMGDHIIECPKQSEETKERIARKSASAKAKEYLETLRKKKVVREEAEQELEQDMKKAARHTVAGQPAAERETARQQTLEELHGFDRPLTLKQQAVAIFYLCLCFFVNRIPFVVINSWTFEMFVKSIKPSFVKFLPSRRQLAGPRRREILLEIQQRTGEQLSATVGKLTLGMDGHRDGRSRVVETFTRMQRSCHIVCVCTLLCT